VLTASLPNSKTIDAFEFNDLLWLPVVLELEVSKFGLLCYSDKQAFKPVEGLLIDRWRRSGTQMVPLSEGPW
jgi:hypothetical protein